MCRRRSGFNREGLWFKGNGSSIRHFEDDQRHFEDDGCAVVGAVLTARACGLKIMDLRSETSKVTKDTSNMTDVPS